MAWRYSKCGNPIGEEDVVCLEIRGSMVVDDDDVQRFVGLLKRMESPNV